jgi:hypothetical protein
MRAQDGVISRRQLRRLAVTDNDIERKLRRREWARITEGVYVEHTGPLTPAQREWAAVLLYWPAALAGASALASHRVRGFDPAEGAPVHICVDRSRSIRRRAGIRVEQLAGWEDKCQLHLSPPRLRIEHALLGEAAARARPDAALALLGDACQQGCTTATRLAAALAARPRLRHRKLLSAILDDVASGAHSALERRYLLTVERPHGLPTAERQRRVRQGKSVAYRDVDYVELATSVELDGRLGHEKALDRWADLERDLSAAAAGELTLRAGWKQVLEPCRLAGVVAQVLASRGWTGVVHPCGHGCKLV